MSTPTVPKTQKRRLQAHFGMTRLPFRKNMTAAKMFDSRSQRDLHHGLMMWTEVKGIALVTGPSGVGKSITLRRFLLDLDEARFRVLRFSTLATTTTGFLRGLSRLLGFSARMHAVDMFDTAQKHLFHHAEECGAHPLIVLDDAEGMRVDTLDLLRRLAAYELDADDRFSILLAATEDLLDVLRTPTLEPLRSRVGYAQSLRPFSLEDTRNYVDFQLRAAGVEPTIFSEDAVRRIFNSSQGKPRRINQVALQAMIHAAVQGLDTIDGGFISTQVAAHPLYQTRTEDT